MAEKINTPSNLEGLLKFVYSDTQEPDKKRKKTSRPMFKNLRSLMNRITGSDYVNKPLGIKE